MATLQDILRSKIAVDTRPRSQMDLFQAGSGRKRTAIVGATVKSITQAQVDNQGATTWGILKQQPMTRSMFRQGPLFDCYMLASAIALTLDDPNWCDDIILPVDARTVIVQYYFRGEIVQITTSLEVSTSYNNPSDDDVRVELLEKTYGFLRSGISDYLKANWGNGIEALQAFGRQVVTVTNRTPANITALRSQKKALVFVTGVNPTKVIGRHAYCLASGSMCINPWDGSVDTSIDATTLATPSEVAAIYAGTTPSPKVLVKPPSPPAPAPPPPPRKYNFPDFVALANHYGQATTKGDADGDFNGDGVVDFKDYTILANGWDASAGELPPEPKSVTPEKPMALELDISTNLGVNLFDGNLSAAVNVQRGREAEIQWTSNGEHVEFHTSVWKQAPNMKPADGQKFRVDETNVVTITAVRGEERLVKTLTITVGNVAPTPTPIPVTPMNDPVVSIIITRKSGRQEVIAG